jgi:hypothetical protein
MRIPVKVTSESESNRLLRALWAVIRAEFGKLVWTYAPVKHGHRNTIYFGWAALDNDSPVRVGVTYCQKGVIHQIVFEGAERVRERIEHCVQVAEERAGNPETYTCRGLLTPNLTIPLQGTAFESVALVPSGDSTIGLHMRVDAFDETDAKAEFTGKARTGADVLAAFTNLFFDFVNEGTESLLPSTSNKAGSSFPEDWLDDYPIADGLLIIPEPYLRLLNSIAHDSIDERKRLIMDACHHFHVGRALDDRQFGPLTINTINQELALVLYLSALEDHAGSRNIVLKPESNRSSKTIMAALRLPWLGRSMTLGRSISTVGSFSHHGPMLDQHCLSWTPALPMASDRLCQLFRCITSVSIRASAFGP